MMDTIKMRQITNIYLEIEHIEGTFMRIRSSIGKMREKSWGIGTFDRLMVLCTAFMLIGSLFMMMLSVSPTVGEANEMLADDLSGGLSKVSMATSGPPLTPHPIIAINNDADMAAQAAAGSWPGNGTMSNPYIIQGYFIDAQNTEPYGILVSNTTAHFIIRNCTVNSALQGSGSFAVGASIFLNHATNATLEHNICWNSYSGVSLRNYCESIRVVENDLSHNTYGLKLERTTDIFVEGNDCSHSSSYGIYLFYSNNNLVESNFCSYSGLGLYLLVSSGNVVKDNQARFCNVYGISIYQSDSNVFQGNDLSYSVTGMKLENSRTDEFYSNVMVKGGFWLAGSMVHFSTHIIGPNNTVNGKPVLYEANGDMNWSALPLGAGQIILANVTNMRVIDQEMDDISNAIILAYCTQLNVSGNLVSKGRCALTALWSEQTTIEQNTFTGCTESAISLSNCKDSAVQRNNLSASGYGVYCYTSERILFAHNTFWKDISAAIELDGSTGCRLFGNLMTGCSISCNSNLASLATNEVATNNTVNGMPVYQYRNGDQGGVSVPRDAGQVIVCNASRVMVNGLDIQNTSYAVIISFAEDVTVSNCTFRNNGYSIYMLFANDSKVVSTHVNSGIVGLRLVESDRNVIEEIRALCTSPIQLASSDGNLFVHCNLSSSSGYLVEIEDSMSNTFKECYLESQSTCISLSGSHENTFMGNDIHGSSWYQSIYSIYSYRDVFWANSLSGGAFLLYGDMETMSTQEISSNNTIDGKPVYYFANGDKSAAIVPGDAGQIIAGNVTGLRVTGITINGSIYPILIGYSDGVRIDNNTFNANRDGTVYLIRTTNARVEDNRFFFEDEPVILEFCQNCIIQRNRIEGSYYGLYLYYSNDCTVRENRINGSSYGMNLYNPLRTVFAGNIMNNCSINLMGDRQAFTSQTIGPDNTVNGKPVIYLKNADLDNGTVGAGAGQIILGNVSHAVISGVVFGNATEAVTIGYSYYVTVANCHMYNDLTGVRIYGGGFNNVTGNSISNSNNGISLYNTYSNLIQGNYLLDSTYSIYVVYSDFTQVLDNILQGDYVAAYMTWGVGGSISGNQATSCYYGVSSYQMDLVTTADNHFVDCRFGLFLGRGADTWTVTRNEFVDCTSYAIYLSDADSCLIYSNTLRSCNGAGQVYDPLHAQAWDNGLNLWNTASGVGNTWYDHLYPDSNHDGIVDTPYLVAGGSMMDHFPKALTSTPWLVISNPTEGAHLTGPYVNVTWSGGDELSGISRFEVKMDGGGWTDVGLRTYWNTSLSLGGGHTVYVKAINQADVQTIGYANFTLSLLPGAPGGLTALQGTGKVTLNWNSADGGGEVITHYLVYRSNISGGYGAPLANLSGTETSYVDTNVVNGNKYYYVVRATNTVGEGPRSNEVNLTFGSGPIAPGAPTGFQALSGGTYATLSWSAPADQGSSVITAYKVYRSTVSGSYGAAIATVSSTTYQDNGLASGTYYYKVSAVNTVEGPKSAEAWVVIQSSGVPGLITDLGTDGFNTFIILHWTAPSPGSSAITGYDVYRDNGSGSLAYLGRATSTAYTDTTVTQGKTYAYRVAAVNGQGQGPVSAPVQGTAKTPAEVVDLLWFIVIGAVVLAVVLILVLYLALRKKP
jgi:parallel beta-helix repeat protein